MNFSNLDEKVKAKLESQPSKFKMKMHEISEKIECPFLTKNNEQLYLYKKTVHNTLPSNDTTITVTYYIVNNDGDVCGKIPVFMNDSPNEVLMDYWLKPSYQNQGIGSVAVATAVNHLFTSGELDGTSFYRKGKLVKTNLESISLQINPDNIPSIKLAQKLGFEKNDSVYTLSREKYLNQSNEKK